MQVTIKGPKNPKREGLALLLGIVIGIFAVLALGHRGMQSMPQPAEAEPASLR